MIRKMELEDYEEVKEIFYEVHNLHLKNRPDIYKDGDPLPKEVFQDFLNNREQLNYVYIINNKIVGVLIANILYTMENSIIKKRKICFIDSIGVRRENQHKGLGKELYNHLKNEISSKDIDAIELNVWNFNENAIKFYESLGMTIKNMRFEEKT